jgi:hypothetical protein
MHTVLLFQYLGSEELFALTGICSSPGSFSRICKSDDRDVQNNNFVVFYVWA